MKKVDYSLIKNTISGLKAADKILFTGLIYTARDQAHMRLVEQLKKHKSLPVELKGKIIYYCGPTKTPKGKVIGSCGPTTSSRMDKFSPELLKAGVIAMIGKGVRSPEVIAAIKKYKAVYFLTYAGCGALLSKCVKRMRPVAFRDLGPEAIYELWVEDFPLIVGIDAKGRDIYKRLTKI